MPSSAMCACDATGASTCPMAPAHPTAKRLNSIWVYTLGGTDMKRMNGRRVVITQTLAFMGKDLIELFGAEGADLLADDRDLTVPGAAEALIAEAGEVDVLAQTFVETPTYSPPSYQATAEFKEWIKGAPLGRLAHGWESAALALFLAGDESDFFVGQVFPFSGGWVTR